FVHPLQAIARLASPEQGACVIDIARVEVAQRARPRLIRVEEAVRVERACAERRERTRCISACTDGLGVTRDVLGGARARGNREPMIERGAMQDTALLLVGRRVDAFLDEALAESKSVLAGGE